MSRLLFTLNNMILAKGHLSKTKSHVGDIRTIGPLLLVSESIFKRFVALFSDFLKCI